MNRRIRRSVLEGVLPVGIDVLKSKSAQLSYLTEENLTMDPELASNNSVVVGQQVRIKVKNSTSKYGLFTVDRFYQDGTDDNDVRMRLSARQRLDQSDSFDAYIEGCDQVALHNKTETWLNSNNEFGEFLDETSSCQTAFLVLAPHGGVIESFTDDQARRVYDELVNNQSKDCSAWYCIGHQDNIGAFDAWHITSTKLAERSFPYLKDVSGRTFSYAVSFHGYSEEDVGIGGLASSDLKNEVKAAIEGIPGFNYDVVVLSSGDYSGTDPNNIVNRYSSNGIQIEQPYSARSNYWQDIADAVAGVLASQ